MDSEKKTAREVIAELSARYTSLNLARQTSEFCHPRLACGIRGVDNFLEGGLPFGQITEFGMPLGKEGRFLLLQFLVNASHHPDEKPMWILWISSHQDYQVFPPAWFSRGVNPSRIVFAHSEDPIRDLKRALINPLFKLIILDSPKIFSKEDCFFVNRQARLNRQLTILLRNFFLSSNRGNIWAKLRINCWKRHASGEFVIRVIRGLSYRELVIGEPCLKRLSS